MARLPMRRMPRYELVERIDRSGSVEVLQYVQERFREAGWCDPNLPCAVKDIKVDTHPDAYFVIIQLPVARKDIPDVMLQLASEIEDELDSRGYPTGIILRPDYALTLASLNQT